MKRLLQGSNLRTNFVMDFKSISLYGSDSNKKLFALTTRTNRPHLVQKDTVARHFSDIYCYKFGFDLLQSVEK